MVALRAFRMSLSTYCPLGKSSISTPKGGPDPTKMPLLFLPHHLDSHSSTFRFSGTFSSGQFIQREHVGHDAVGLISSEGSALHLFDVQHGQPTSPNTSHCRAACFPWSFRPGSHIERCRKGEMKGFSCRTGSEGKALCW